MSINRTLTLSPIPHPPTSISITSSTKDSTPHYGLLLCVHTFTKRRNRDGCLCICAPALRNPPCCARKLSNFTKIYWFSLRKCDHTVSYHLYIVIRYLWLPVPHIIGICQWRWVTDPQVPHNYGKMGQNGREQIYGGRSRGAFWPSGGAPKSHS